MKQAALAAKAKFQAAKDKYDRFPAELVFINFPVPDEYFVSDDLVEALCRELEARIRSGKVCNPLNPAIAWPPHGFVPLARGLCPRRCVPS